MPSSLEKVIESLPHPKILPIVGEPTYETLAEINLKLNTNSASVHSHLLNGQLGLLYLTVLPDVYLTHSATPFVPPANVGPPPTVPNGSTAVQTTSIRQQHELDTQLYRKYDTTDKALMSLLIASVDETYIWSLRNKYIGYANISTLQMLTNLYSAYAKITESYLEENEKPMRANYNVN